LATTAMTFDDLNRSFQCLILRLNISRKR